MNKTISRKRHSIITNITKTLAIAYIIVSKAFVPLGIVSSVVMQALLVMVFVFSIASDKMKFTLNSFLKVELLFMAITITTSFIVGKDYSYIINTAQTLIYGFMFGYAMFCIMRNSKSMNWFVLSWVIAGVIMVSYILLTGGYARARSGRITANEEMNTNTLGVFLTFSICGVIILLSNLVKKSRFQAVAISAGIGLIALFLYMIIASGSRKAFLASAFAVLFWLIIGLIPLLKNISPGKRIISLAFMSGIILFIYFKYGTSFAAISTTLMYRLNVLSGKSVTDLHRWELIVDALKVFGDHAVFGVGWNNYRFYSAFQQYSHNTYVEVLACTGVSGSVFAYYLWLLIGKNYYKNVRRYKNSAAKLSVIILLAITLFIDTGQIMYYNSSLLMIFHFLYAVSSTEFVNANMDLCIR